MLRRPEPRSEVLDALFLLDHALLCIGRTLLLDRNALIYTVKNIMFTWKMLLSRTDQLENDSSGTADREMFLEQN